ncbi:hypothetical protein ZWY2020_032878 [Hordeum vulgare]|nr:hypothetical protein ZWY2020_032878 [Hordeum vulgare]
MPSSMAVVMGNNSFKTKQWSKAIEFYSGAIKLNDTNATYYCNRAAAYLELGRNSQFFIFMLLLAQNLKAYLRQAPQKKVVSITKRFYKVYASSANMFSRTSMFDNTPCSGPKAIVSEYAVTRNDAGKGTLVVNFGSKAVDLNITVTGLGSGIKSSGSKKTVLTSATPLDENSFQQPEKVAPVSSPVADAK